MNLPVPYPQVCYACTHLSYTVCAPRFLFLWCPKHWKSFRDPEEGLPTCIILYILNSQWKVTFVSSFEFLSMHAVTRSVTVIFHVKY